MRLPYTPPLSRAYYMILHGEDSATRIIDYEGSPVTTPTASPSAIRTLINRSQCQRIRRNGSSMLEDTFTFTRVRRNIKEARVEVEAIVENQRKEKELERMAAAEKMAILRLANTDPLEFERRMRVHRLRYKNVLPWGLAGVVRFGHVVEVLTEEQAQEQIEAEDREEAAARERREEQAEMFGLKPEPEPEPGIADGLASERVLQPRTSSPRPPKDTSRRTRGGRITKNAAQKGTRSRRATPTPSKAPMPDPAHPPRRSQSQSRARSLLQPPESPAAPTQGPELGYHADKHLAALLVDYQWFRRVLDSGSRPVVPRPNEDLGR
ncbi:uncharacterized protein PAC_15157 [Phialocephala subalpina]|uniref:Uncharacterized protein n=1 Tax=Phialocephala subalpina TaxID=576137 RepID=A0A1L7XJY2_9HELO|nr:uncharacterized protein PAC_15157 [Phialocephala subalpina]